MVLPTYNEKDSIADIAARFEALDVVDEVIVVNNNAAEGTSEEVARTGAREVVETTQGYGAAIKRGLREADTDLVAICEPDGTFDPADLHKSAGVHARVRLRRRLAHGVELHLARGQHGLVPAVGELGGRQG
ncbi:glycosyltransferase [Nocardioides convexus]|uniref:glycosyltransferase n=1 Tax=Nocardioides convexus TaxID=2712224 RepID=UPI00241846B8|nr:glycosyltransferase [Nocardioides convexus]